MELILASGSPRRKELLELAGLSFTIKIPGADESVPLWTHPRQAVETIAGRKAHAVLEQEPSALVLAADTLVSIDGRPLGKPASEEEAFQMLRLLSGNTHEVYTGFCLLSSTDEISGTECTQVEFYPLSEKEIREYIRTGEPMDKAGAYGIQGKGAMLVKKITGDYYNVMGLPIARVVRLISKLQSGFREIS